MVNRKSRVSRRPAHAEIDLSAVAANASLVKRLIGDDCRLAAVVKANGYGLGSVPVALAALHGGASYLAVATVDEGVELRLAGITVPILVMSYVPPEEAESAVRYKLTLTLHGLETAAALEKSASDLGLTDKAVPVHVKVDTGLGRYGCLPEEVIPFVQQVANWPHLQLEGLMTHFADADSNDLTFTIEQVKVFREAQRSASDAGIRFKLIHAANSAATLTLPDAHYDMVRVGIMLYGILPAEHFHSTIVLCPVLTIKSRLARVFPVHAGDTIGYGRTWTARSESYVGLVPVGYADGYRRALSNRAQVLVGGQRLQVVGRVSMDQIAIDLGNSGEAREGEEVILVGRQGDEEITVTDLAGWADTIPYEIITGLGARLPRVYLWEGKVVGHRDLLGGNLSLSAPDVIATP